MRIMGIDPGYGIVGYGVLELTGNRMKVVGSGIIETERKKSFPERLVDIFEGMMKLIEKYEPDEVSMEKLYFFRNVTTAIEVGEARGVIILALTLKKIKINEYTPYQVKMAVTGYGRARKENVRDMVMKILNLKERPKFDDVSDALAIAICHANSYAMKRRVGEFDVS